MGDVDQHYKNVARPAAPSSARKLAGLTTPAPLVVEPVADAVLEPAAPVVLVAEPLPPVPVPDAAPADVEFPDSKKIPPVGEAGALVTAEDEVDELAAAVLVLEAVELETLVSKWRPPATEYLDAQVVRSSPSGQHTVWPVVSAAQ